MAAVSAPPASIARLLISEGAALAVGCTVETLTIVTLRACKDITSQRVRDLPVGTRVTVEELGDEGGFRRGRVGVGNDSGWITLTTSAGVPLVRPSKGEENPAPAPFEVGAVQALRTLTPMRAGEDLSAPLVAELEQDSLVRILELGKTRKARARVVALTTGGQEGWISLMTSTGQHLVGPQRLDLVTRPRERFSPRPRPPAEASPEQLAEKKAAAQRREQERIQRQKRQEREAKRAQLSKALQTCKADGDMSALRQAMEDADREGLCEAEVEDARQVLERDSRQQATRESLRMALETGNMDSLEGALATAREAGLSPMELAPYAEVVRAARSKAKAETALARALQSRNVDSLRAAIQAALGSSVNADLLAEAEEVLKVELPRKLMREELARFQAGAAISELEDALARACELSIASTEIEFKYVERLLEQEKEKMTYLEAVQEVMSMPIDKQDIESLRAAKAALQEALLRAKMASVSEDALKEAELRRRRLHNAIEDLKGSIRVFCRVRPLSTKEQEAGDTGVTKPIDNMTLQVGFKGVVTDAHSYVFDAVFTPGTQDEVFEDCCDLVQSALDGYNVTMFAYGQTGSGKTFTIYGAPGNEGAAPRTIRELYRLLEQDRRRFTHTVGASMLELYKNDLVDLLVERVSPRKSSIFNGPAPNDNKLCIRIEPRTQEVYVEGLTEEDCRSEKELLRLLDRGNKARSVAATAMNTESSRSHLVLIIRVVRTNIETGQVLQGKILICDLAGSERLKKSAVEGDNMKEAIEINKSLTALGDVIEGLTSNKSHIPYKNHKLTQLMQDSLGGTSKTLMFVNCSPALSNLDETTNALKYATRAKGITNDVKKTSRQSLMRASTFASMV